MDTNFQTYEYAVGEYQDYSLNPAEIVVLNIFKNDWHKISMLDIGIGTGRTTYTFTAITGDYIGLDYSPKMIEQCRKNMPEGLNVKLAVSDARDLSKYYNKKFDFILFSLNGIDSVGLNDRIQILEEVRKTLNTKGYFFFSTHLLNYFSIDFVAPPIDFKRLPKTVYRYYTVCKRFIKLRYLYRNESIEKIQKNNWKVLITGDHAFKMRVFHINFDFQINQLNEAGFQIEMILDSSGRQLSPVGLKPSKWAYFLCKPKR